MFEIDSFANFQLDKKTNSLKSSDLNSLKFLKNPREI